MKRFTGFSAVAVLAMALAAMPVCAQTRGGGSRGGGGGSHYSGGGGGRSSSMSAPSRGGSYGGSSMSRGGGSSRSYSAPSSSYSRQAPTRSSSPSYSTRSQSTTRSYSSPSSSYRRQTPGSSSSSVTRSQSATRSTAPSSMTRSQSATRSTAPSGVTRSQSATRGTAPSGVTRSQMATRSSAPASAARSTALPSGVTRANSGQPRMQATRSGIQAQPHGQPERVNIGGGHGPGRIAPRHRDPMPFNRPARFWDHGHHFFGYRVHYLPSRYHIHRYWGRDYYIIDGLYYRHYLDYYYVCRPPFGVFFDPILDDIAYAACNIAYYASTYNAFHTINENASTITAQNQIIAENNATIARQNETIALNSERAAAAQLAADQAGLVQSYADVATEYFYDDGVFFTKDKSGKYVTIVPPAGALVKELPDDYDTITLDGKEYYKVDDTVFTTSVVDGTVYFEVLGQLTGELADKYDFNNK